MNALQWLAIGLGLVGSVLSLLLMWGICIIGSDADDAMGYEDMVEDEYECWG